SAGGRGAQQSAILTSKGRSVLLLDIAFQVVSTNGEERLSLPVGGSGITSATVSLSRPSNDLDVKIAGGFLSEQSPTRWIAYARGTEPLTFTWKRRIEERRVELPLRMRGSLIQLYGLGEDATSLNAEVDLEVTQGSAKQGKIAVPENVTINQVPGA